MKRLIIGLVLSLLATWLNAETISIRADYWFPMNGEPNSAKPGFMIELAQKIFEKAGYGVDYNTMPWERALAQVRQGSFDCVVGAYKEDAPDFVFPSENWGIDKTEFFVKSGSTWKYEGIASLEGRKLGVIGGYAYDEAFDNYVKQSANVAVVKGDDALEKNIKKLTAGRIDTTIESPLVMNAKLKEMGMLGQISSAGKLGEASPMYIACSPAKERSKELVKLIDKETQALRASGELNKIMETYGLTDWK